MSLAAQFYLSDLHTASNLLPAQEEPARRTRRPLYEHTVESHHESHVSSSLTEAYRGAGASSLPREGSIEHDDVALTEAERANFAAELAMWERQQAEHHRRQSKPTTRHHASSLEEHLDPHLLSDTSLPATFFPHARARMRAYEQQQQSTSHRQDESGFFEKGERWRERRQQKNDALKLEIEQQAELECTFRPHINTSSNREFHSTNLYHEDAEDDGGDASGGTQMPQRHTSLDVTSRLLQFEKQRRNRVSILAHEQEQAHSKTCTFRPRTNKKSWTAAVTPRYLDYVDKPQQHQTTSPDVVPTSAATEDGSFWPVTNNPKALGSETSTRLQTYLQQPAYQRLNACANDRAVRRDREQQALTKDAARIQEAPSYIIGETTLSSIGAATAIGTNVARGPSADLEETDPFLIRRKAAMIEREKNLDSLRQAEMARNSFQPAILDRKPRPVVVRKKDKYTPEKPTFKPKIDKYSAATCPQRTVNDLLKYQSDKQEKQARIQQEAALLQQARERAEGEAHTPRISHYAQGVQGKVAPSTHNMDDYKRFVAMQRRIRQRDIELHIRERQESEDRELTFRPEIHPAPAFIHEIVKELRQSRRSSSRSTSLA